MPGSSYRNASMSTSIGAVVAVVAATVTLVDESRDERGEIVGLVGGPCAGVLSEDTEVGRGIIAGENISCVYCLAAEISYENGQEN